MKETYDQEGINALGQAGRPIRGQAMFADPNSNRPWETPPEFTKWREALHYVIEILLQKENLSPILSSIGKGVPIMDIVHQILYVGFREGKWSADLMMLLAEPLAYVLIALCERAAIAYRIDSDDPDGGLIYSDEEENKKLKDENVKRLLNENFELRKAKNLETILPKKTAALVEEAADNLVEEGGVYSNLLAQEEQVMEEEVEEVENNLLDRS